MPRKGEDTDLKGLRRWRKRGYYSERALVKKLQSLGFNAVRIPVSNPSLSPLPDVIGRQGMNVYAFEVKNARYYAYFPPHEVIKLFQYLEQFVPLPKEYLKAVLVAHLKKKWIFKVLDWKDYLQENFEKRISINRRQHGNWKPKKEIDKLKMKAPRCEEHPPLVNCPICGVGHLPDEFETCKKCGRSVCLDCVDHELFLCDDCRGNST